MVRAAAVVDHCIGTACLASLLAERFGTSGELFLGGLLHDIALLILKRRDAAAATMASRTTTRSTP